MFNWLKNAFSAGGNTSSDAVQGDTVEYKGYRITPTPIAESGQFRVSGIIEKEADPEKKHTFIRSDLVAGKDAACEFTLVKARLIIDQMGDRLFDQ